MRLFSKTFSVISGSLVALSLCTSANALEANLDAETALTIYSKAGAGGVDASLYRPLPGQNTNYHYNQIPGYAVVRHIRNIKIPDNRYTVRFSDVAAYIDPTTVSFKSLTAPESTSVLEQSFQFDIVSRQKLLQKYIGKEVEIQSAIGDEVEYTKGNLLSATPGDGILLMQDSGEVKTFNYTSNVSFPKLSKGLITKPTLVWNVVTEQIGRHKTETAYQTEGITWWADYNITFTPDDDRNKGSVDLSSWVSIINKSGATYTDAKLKLIAGDVNKVQPAPAPVLYKSRMAMPEMAMADMGNAGFAEKQFFEYHLYTLGRPATLPENSTKQIELFPSVKNVPVDKKFIYKSNNHRFYGGINTGKGYGTNGNKKIEVYIKFDNAEENNMGMPLPKGRLRVYQKDTDDNSLEFIGEDTIDHTPKDEEVMIKLGNAFDLVGERKQIDYYYQSTRKEIEEEYEIIIKNRGNKAATIDVVENLYRAANWKIIEANAEYDKNTSNQVIFPVTVEGDSEKKIKYRVKYWW